MPAKIDFIGGNTKRSLMTMALPMIAAMFLNMMYNLVDSLWIGSLLGETAYAALTNSTPIILILTSIAMGSTNGGSILLSQAIGAKDKRRTESLTATLFIHLCVRIPCGLFILLFCRCTAQLWKFNVSGRSNADNDNPKCSSRPCFHPFYWIQWCRSCHPAIRNNQSLVHAVLSQDEEIVYVQDYRV